MLGAVSPHPGTGEAVATACGAGGGFGPPYKNTHTNTPQIDNTVPPEGDRRQGVPEGGQAPRLKSLKAPNLTWPAQRALRPVGAPRHPDTLPPPQPHRGEASEH